MVTKLLPFFDKSGMATAYIPPIRSSRRELSLAGLLSRLFRRKGDRSFEHLHCCLHDGGQSANRDLPVFDPAPAAIDHERRRRRLATRERERRSLRAQFVSAPIFAEPGWDILLAVYIRELSGESFTLTDLETTTSLPRSTAQRWLAVLAEQKLLAQTKNDFIELTRLGRNVLNDYFDALD
jgi:predicted transcriptional regulator